MSRDRTGRAAGMPTARRPRHRGPALACCAAVLLAAGCSSQRRLNRSDAVPAAPPWPDPVVQATYPSTDATVVGGLAAALGADATTANGSLGAFPPAAAPGRPLNVLVLSGGGKFTSFNVGTLVGWTAAGTRPNFDVVTGISSGALAAGLAFLGPKYDERMVHLYTDFRRKDLFRVRPFLYIPATKALASSEPLRKIIEREVDEAFVADLRKAHAEGRRLFVATNQVKAQRPVIWDMGAVAGCGRPDAVPVLRRIFLAACSIPGFTPSVEFDVEVNGCHYTERHGDAGTHTEGFVQTAAGLPAGSNVYVLTAGKYFADPLRDDAGFLTTYFSNVTCALSALYRADLMKIYSLCAVTHSHFFVTALPQDFPGNPSSLVFDPEETKRLYDYGYKLALGGVPWQTVPPGVPTNEQTPVRNAKWPAVR